MFFSLSGTNWGRGDIRGLHGMFWAGRNTAVFFKKRGLLQGNGCRTLRVPGAVESISCDFPLCALPDKSHFSGAVRMGEETQRTLKTLLYNSYVLATCIVDVSSSFRAKQRARSEGLGNRRSRARGFVPGVGCHCTQRAEEAGFLGMVTADAGLGRGFNECGFKFNGTSSR